MEYPGVPKALITNPQAYVGLCRGQSLINVAIWGPLPYV